MLSDSDLLSMRGAAGAAMPDSCAIQGQTFVSDAGGGGEITWTTAATVDCRLAPIRGDEGLTGGRISADAEFLFTLPHDAPITTDSRIIHDGDIYNVAAIRDRSWPITTRVEAVRE